MRAWAASHNRAKHAETGIEMSAMTDTFPHQVVGHQVDLQSSMGISTPAAYLRLAQRHADRACPSIRLHPTHDPSCLADFSHEFATNISRSTLALLGAGRRTVSKDRALELTWS